MSSIHLTKRIFPNAPEWVHGGLFFVGLLWMIVLPVEILQILTNQDFLRPSLLGWIIRSFYFLDFGTSLAMISALTNASYYSHPWSSFSVVLLGLFLSSPAYFVPGALLSTRNTGGKILGILLLSVMFFFGCFATIGIMFSD
jgi:hypothetical protein